MSEFAVEDDGLHRPSDGFYENETFWFSFFVPSGSWADGSTVPFASIRA